MKPKKATLMILIFPLLLSCAYAPKIKTTSVMKYLYQPYREISFCLPPEGKIHNLIAGGYFSVPLALCNKGDISMHSHPVYSPGVTSIVDWLTWEWRRSKYGDDCFGVMKKDFYRVYCKEKKEK